MSLTATAASQALESLKGPTPPRRSLLSEYVFIAKQIKGSDPDLLSFVTLLKAKCDLLRLDKFSIDKRMNAARKVWTFSGLKQNPNYDAIRAKITLPQADWSLKSKTYDESVRSRMEDPVFVKSDEVEKAFGIADRMAEDGSYMAVIACMLAIGCRVSEIVGPENLMASFERDTEQPEDHVTFTNNCKTRYFNMNKHDTEADPRYLPDRRVRRPLMFCTADRFFELVKYARLGKSRSPTFINKHVNGCVKWLLFPCFEAIPDEFNISSHLLRKIYIQFACKRFFPNVPEEYVAKKLLDHVCKESKLTYHTIRVRWAE